MKRIILYMLVISGCTSCNESWKDDLLKQNHNITKIGATIASNETRVTLGIDPLFKIDNAYWKDDDFLFVAELTESANLFTGHILKYNYVPSSISANEAKGTFSGIGMVTGGKYLIVNTNIPNLFIGLPQIGDRFFECTFKNTFYCNSSFGDNTADIQQIANELLFIGTVVIPDASTDIDIPLLSPMSMIELRLTADGVTDEVQKINIESADEVFSYKIYTDHVGECQSQSVSNNYDWTKLNSEVIYTTGHYQTLSSTNSLKVRVLAFQKAGTKTSLKITATLNDGSILSYTTPIQTQTLTPNAVTVINAHLN